MAATGAIVVLRASDLQPVYGMDPRQMHESFGGSTARDNVYWWRDGDGVKIWDTGNQNPIHLSDAKLDEKDNLAVSGDLQRAVMWGENHAPDLWDLTTKKSIRTLAPVGRPYVHVGFTFKDTAVQVCEEGRVCSLFASQDGAPLAQRFTRGSIIYYDPDLRRFHLWNEAGQVLRYVEGRSYFGKFVPTRSNADKLQVY
jgi:hypothetical protein